jgi:hypothetical protein
MLNPRIERDPAGVLWLVTDPVGLGVRVYDAAGKPVTRSFAPGKRIKLGAKDTWAGSVAALTVSEGAREPVQYPAAPPPPPPSGATRPLFTPKCGPDTDSFLNHATSGDKAWVNAHWHLPIVYVDWWTSWLPSQHYLDVAAIYNPNHPDHRGPALTPEVDSWILRDSAGNRLFIPWGPKVNGEYPQFAADQSNPGYRAHVLDVCGKVLAAGHKGIHLDDVNLPMSLSGVPAGLSVAQQKDAVAGMVETIRGAFPAAFLSANTRWFDAPNHDGKDPYQERIFKAADQVTLERGLTDSGLRGGTGEWSCARLFSFVDHVHSFGCSVNWMSYASAAADVESNLAAAWLCFEPGDAVCGGGKTPADMSPLYGVELGLPLGPRQAAGDLWRRDFEHGHVTVDAAARVGKVAA